METGNNTRNYEHVLSVMSFKKVLTLREIWDKQNELTIEQVRHALRLLSESKKIIKELRIVNGKAVGYYKKRK